MKKNIYHLKVYHAGMNINYVDIIAESFYLHDGAYIFTKMKNDGTGEILNCYPIAMTAIESIEEVEDIKI